MQKKMNKWEMEKKREEKMGERNSQDEALRS